MCLVLNLLENAYRRDCSCVYKLVSNLWHAIEIHISSIHMCNADVAAMVV